MQPQVTGESVGNSRVGRLRQWLQGRRVGAFLITNLINIKYLTGFSGSSGYVLATGTSAGTSGCYFFTDFRYKEQSASEISSCDIVITKHDPIKFIIKFIEDKKIKKLAIEDTLCLRSYKMLSKRFALEALTDAVENIRMDKDEDELRHIKTAIQRAQTALLDIKPRIRVGVTERAIASMLENGLKAQGVEKLPFEIIVASGKYSSMPHARPTDKALEKGDLLIIDWGGESGGYFSDMTRTFLIGGGNDLGRKKEIYDIVLKANVRARESIKAGQSASDVDRAARAVIKDAGFAQYFGHSTGHGVGVEVHEKPYIAAVNKRQKIAENMVFTIEPGIYIPELGGVRIEDMVCVNGQAAQTITNLSRNLEIL
ncbi:MAG: aminopeptidase P family protein [Nitrospirae bacterium]|nr:aminopeptidase P family protein [Nitrospirota bacterium]